MYFHRDDQGCKVRLHKMIRSDSLQTRWKLSSEYRWICSYSDNKAALCLKVIIRNIGKAILLRSVTLISSISYARVVFYIMTYSNCCSI